jgi:hypothetical protein
LCLMPGGSLAAEGTEDQGRFCRFSQSLSLVGFWVSLIDPTSYSDLDRKGPSQLSLALYTPDFLFCVTVERLIYAP